MVIFFCIFSVVCLLCDSPQFHYNIKQLEDATDLQKIIAICFEHLFFTC